MWDDIQNKRNIASGMEEANNESYAELQETLAQHGQNFTMDTSDMRRELFIDHLVECDVLSEDQKLDFDIKFHTKIETSLNGAWADYREKAAKAKLTVVKKPVPKLIGPNGQPLGGA